MALFLLELTMARNVTNKHTHKIADYPKWVDGVLYKSEDDEIERYRDEDQRPEKSLFHYFAPEITRTSTERVLL